MCMAGFVFVDTEHALQNLMLIIWQEVISGHFKSFMLTYPFWVVPPMTFLCIL